MRRKMGKRERARRKAEREAAHREHWKQFALNAAYDNREAAKSFNNAKKRAVVVELYRYGAKNDQIVAATEWSLAFVNDAIRDFAHQCLADEVRTHG
ncbi:MAG TPA: hypothetical protein VNX88_18635 [Terriglobales bacterium]|jgi:hypothetical protein|nr:hypothetical protein [Terriglobales bacterium]